MTDYDDFPKPVPEPVAVEEKPATPPKPQKVSREDRLEVENLSMKIQNVQLQLQIMQSDLQKALMTRNDLVEQMKKKRDEYMQKYGIDIATVAIADDGTVTPLQNPIKIPGMP